MRSNIYLFFCFICCFKLNVFAQKHTDHLTSSGKNINAKFYGVSVDVDLEKEYIKGLVKFNFVAIQKDVKTFSLDLHDNLKVSKIDGAHNFKQNNNKLYITLKDPLKKETKAQVTIHYEGIPGKEIINDVEKGLIYSTHGKLKNQVISTVCYPNGSYLWFPCKKGFGDKVDSIYVNITIPDTKVKSRIYDQKSKKMQEKEMSYMAVSNGTLKNVIKADGKKTYQWRHYYRIAPHHIMIAISNYAKAETVYKKNGYQFPMSFYFFPEKFKEGSSMMKRAPEIMTCLTNTFGDYPFRKEGFAITQLGVNLGLDGMPTQTNVSLEDFKSTNMYKLVHQMACHWFGNHISPAKWQDVWMTEALAAYAEALWQEYKRGLTVYQIILDEKEYFEGGKLFLDSKQDYSKERFNKKGMYTLHMLRGIMGDEYFFQSLQSITGKKRIRGGFSKTYLSTKNFQEICEYYASENIDQDFDYFFKQWVHGEYYPIFEVKHQIAKGKVKLEVNQEVRVSTPNFFSMPVHINLVFEDGSIEKKHILLDDAKKEFFFDMPKGKTLKELQFDPKNWIFKEMKYIRTIKNTKSPILDVDFRTTQHRRQINLDYNVIKKQDVTIKLIRKANGITQTEDEVVSEQVFTKEKGEQTKHFKIPLGLKSRGVFVLRVEGKSDIYEKELRLKRIKEIF